MWREGLSPGDPPATASIVSLTPAATVNYIYCIPPLELFAQLRGVATVAFDMTRSLAPQACGALRDPRYKRCRFSDNCYNAILSPSRSSSAVSQL